MQSFPTISSVCAYLAGVVFAFSLAFPAAADEFEETVILFKSSPATESFFDNAYGYAVFPTIGKAGIGIGGAFGSGRVFAGGELMGTTTMSQVTVGLQLGGQAFSQIIFFEDQSALKQFTDENFEFGAQATAVALTASASAQATTGGGASASAGTEAYQASQVQSGYRKGMAIFTVAKGGLMYEASIGGQRFNYRPL